MCAWRQHKRAEQVQPQPATIPCCRCSQVIECLSCGYAPGFMMASTICRAWGRQLREQMIRRWVSPQQLKGCDNGRRVRRPRLSWSQLGPGCASWHVAVSNTPVLDDVPHVQDTLDSVCLASARWTLQSHALWACHAQLSCLLPVGSNRRQRNGRQHTIAALHRTSVSAFEEVYLNESEGQYRHR